jgi:hypothetical protein
LDQADKTAVRGRAVRKTYLGDGAYADFRNGMVVVYTDNGFFESNHIWLGLDECLSLLRFLKEAFYTDDAAEADRG